MMGECITALHGFAAVNAALLQQERIRLASSTATSSTPQNKGSSSGSVVVDISLQRSGAWCLSCICTLVLLDPHKAKLWDVAVEEIPLSWPLPTMTAVITSDGVSVQLLGLDFPKHLKPTLMSLGAPVYVSFFFLSFFFFFFFCVFVGVQGL
jgi:hypothetical protein